MYQGTLIVAGVVAGYLLGSIPSGYLLVKTFCGKDIREYGSHNIGATNVLRVVGWKLGLATLLLDVGKGLLAVLIAQWLTGSAGAIVAAALASLTGHAYSLYFYIRERRFSRGKAIASGLGVVIGMAIARPALWVALAVWVGLWLLFAVGPRLVSRRFGYVSIASIVATLSLPVSFLLIGAEWPFVLFGILASIFVLWKHKENIGRFMDGTEPRLGEKPPLAGVDDASEVGLAFMIHPMGLDDLWQARRFFLARWMWGFGLLPEVILRRLVLLIRPMKVDEVRSIVAADGRRARVYLIGVPMMPDQIKAYPGLAVERAIQAARLAGELGVNVFGLGAYWSVVGNKGQDVQNAVPHVHVTNGGALTAGSTRKAVPAMLRRLAERGVDATEVTAAVVGANGVVGFGVCRLLAESVGGLLMVGTDLERLERSAALLRRRHPAVHIETTTDLERLRECALIFTATSQPEPVVLPEHVSPGTLLYDLGRPADIHRDVERIEGVEVVPGGVVRPPGGFANRVTIHFGEGLIPACLAETVIIALDGCYERKSLGDHVKMENITYFLEKARELGFEIVERGVEITPAAADAVTAPTGAWRPRAGEVV